jgi:hypothetical protein
MRINVEKLWEQIAEESQGNNWTGIVKRLIDPTWTCKISIGINLESNQRLFLLEAKYNILRNYSSLPQTNGFEANIRFFGDEDDNCMSLCLTVIKPQFHDLFGSLINDILNHINIENVESSIETVVSRLLRWQKFLEQFRLEGLGDEAQRGLFGELHLLKRLLDNGVEFSRVLRAWKGPERTVHDFQFDNCSLEVKTSISKQHQKVQISSERQLDTSQTDVLYMCHLSLDNQSGKGRSLNQMVQEIRSVLSEKHLLLDIFEDQLFTSGYLDVHYKRYNEPIYSIREYSLFKIANGFPRIIESDLIEGVGDVKYSIMISQCKNYTVQEDEVIQMIGEFKYE